MWHPADTKTSHAARIVPRGMNPIANDSLASSTRRWVLVGAALTALFIASLVLLASHAAPMGAGSDQVQLLDTGL